MVDAGHSVVNVRQMRAKSRSTPQGLEKVAGEMILWIYTEWAY